MEGDLLCFVCDKFFPMSQAKNHVNKCKVIYEHQNNCHLVIPEEYGLIFTAIEGGVMPDADTVENFNRMIDEKSVKNGGSIATDAEFREMNKKFTDTIKKSKEKTVPPRRAGER